MYARLESHCSVILLHMYVLTHFKQLNALPSCADETGKVRTSFSNVTMFSNSELWECDPGRKSDFYTFQPLPALREFLCHFSSFCNMASSSRTVASCSTEAWESPLSMRLCFCHNMWFNLFFRVLHCLASFLRCFFERCFSLYFTASHHDEGLWNSAFFFCHDFQISWTRVM